jgi:hypothetical protein
LQRLPARPLQTLSNAASGARTNRADRVLESAFQSNIDVRVGKKIARAKDTIADRRGDARNEAHELRLLAIAQFRAPGCRKR